MRLHKISLLNLNSLYGEQSLDLEHDLPGASLFLIHGRTGSGKSTVMDAVSLALFGKTPRLDSQRNVLGADPCSIMSRGTGECRAEVEFSRLFADRSRVRYRAIWSVRRAHKRADGSLQPVERSLEQLGQGGQWKVLASGKKLAQFNDALSEVLEDFTVEDFHRSMLLAQGRFDELLSAKPEHRAAILERLTNTTEYATIGSNAAEVARAHKKNVEFLNRQFGDATPVNEEEMRLISGAATMAHAQTDLQTFELNVRKSRLQWWTDRKRLCDEIGELDGEKLALEQLAAQCAPTLAKIAEHTRCLAGFGAMDRLVDLDGKWARSAAEVSRNGAILTEASELRERNILRRDSAERTAQLAEDLLQNLQIPCAAYVAAQDAVDAAKRLLDDFQAQLADAQSAFTKKTNDWVQSAAALERANQDAARTKEVLAACQTTQWIREQWKAHWQELCISLESIEKKLGHDTLDLVGREQQLLLALNKARAREEEYARHRATLLAEPESMASRRYARLAELAGAEEPKSRIRALRDAAEQQRSAIAAMESAQRELLAGDALRDELERAHARLVEAVQTTATKATETAQAREVAILLALRRTDADKHLHRLELVVEVTKRREALSKGEQCPLCGSVEHPYLDDPGGCPDDATILQALTDARTERERVEQQARAAEHLAREVEKHAEKCKHERDARQKECDEIGTKLLRCAEATVNARTTARLPEECRSEDCTELLTEQTLQLKARQEALQDLEEATDSAEQAQRELTGVQLALQKEAESLKVTRIALEERRKTLQAQRVKLDETRQDFEARRSTFRAALRQADANLSFALETNTTEDAGLLDWRRRIEARIAVLELAERSCETTEIKRREALTQKEHDSTALSEAEQRLGHARTQESEQNARYRKLCDHTAELLRAISGLWVTREHDDPTEQALPEVTDCTLILERARERARRLRENARQRREDAEAAIQEEQRFQGMLNALNAARAGLERDRSQAHEECLGVLAQLGLETVELLRSRRMQPDELRAEQAKVDALDRQRQAWKIRREERLLALEKHELAIPAGLTVPDETSETWVTTTSGVGARGEPIEQTTIGRFEAMLKAAVTDAEAQLKVANDDERECQIKLADTQRRMTAHAAAGEALREAQNKASVWLALDALIGTRNGDAFRQFAQGLNLHRLIQKSNIHLQQLSERYELTQARSEELPTLDFAIKDHWQGGEPRSTRTLSGGERFLVSLALALGLSDLRTQSLPIETLVLDEGFGTLDPETLEVALAALQRLHADGRQVGVISHVNGLKERIEARVRIVEEGAGRSRIVVG